MAWVLPSSPSRCVSHFTRRLARCVCVVFLLRVSSGVVPLAHLTSDRMSTLIHICGGAGGGAERWARAIAEMRACIKTKSTAFISQSITEYEIIIQNVTHNRRYQNARQRNARGVLVSARSSKTRKKQ